MCFCAWKWVLQSYFRSWASQVSNDSWTARILLMLGRYVQNVPLQRSFCTICTWCLRNDSWIALLLCFDKRRYVFLKRRWECSKVTAVEIINAINMSYHIDKVVKSMTFWCSYSRLLMIYESASWRSFKVYDGFQWPFQFLRPTCHLRSFEPKWR